MVYNVILILHQPRALYVEGWFKAWSILDGGSRLKSLDLFLVCTTSVICASHSFFELTSLRAGVLNLTNIATL